MRETAIASLQFVSLSRQPRSKKIKFTSVSGNLRKVPLQSKCTRSLTLGDGPAASRLRWGRFFGHKSSRNRQLLPPVVSMERKEASHESLAKIISTKVQ